MIDFDLYEAKKLYPFQEQTVNQVLEELRKNGTNFNLLYQLPTGGGKTVIFSSHIMSEVDLLCDDLAIVHKGQLKHNGTMLDFRQNMEASNLTEEFIRIVQR
jgi:ABC-type Na+ transport system ATPase subunit NatA